MKRFFVYKVVILVCLFLSFPCATFSGNFPGLSFVCKEEMATITKNGTDVNGRVFTPIITEPENLLVLTWDEAFKLDTGELIVYDIAVDRIKEETSTQNPGVYYNIISEVVGAGLEKTGDGVFTFTVRGDLYEVRLQDQMKLDLE